MPNRTIDVMVVDDSAVVRRTVGALLAQAPGMRLLHAVSDPPRALERMQRQWPDVIVLDIEMPRTDGLAFLKKLMAERPTPVVVCSALAGGPEAAMAALAAGAVSVIAKPQLGLKDFLHERAGELVAAVRAAAYADVRRLGARPPPAAPAPKLTADAVLAPLGAAQASAHGDERVVAIGASTGGTQALEAVLAALPPGAPGIVVVQHMPAQFTAAFAERLDRLSRIAVREARHGDRVLPGLALIAPGGRHLLLRRDGDHYRVDVVDGPPVSRHRPSVDVLFRSAARHAGTNALGILMTGMGDDGAAGMLEMRRAGARTLAQDEHSCVVYGMPKEAVKRGGVERTVALGAIEREIVQFGAAPLTWD
ncbi:chemotaxis response regulator protein-glutamate methylesterase [Massilia forsythiae]|uniref:Protein-glutamate methylesterase/protein-glutamine glutaminase n=1 Tax=Massilia forsythiae TaxID=2728020 RepID=A0A7Z2VXP1_9BURK|nr:chemotaxis response regulator protein-glutamate methylesterase [Massilia forsythiae]QJE01191.1 chemotaxis response regulator protein-glutamate methylesterase [Massilia forsythiae]